MTGNSEKLISAPGQPPEGLGRIHGYRSRERIYQTVFGIVQVPWIFCKHLKLEMLFALHLNNYFSRSGSLVTPISIPRVLLRETTGCPLDLPLPEHPSRAGSFNPILFQSYHIFCYGKETYVQSRSRCSFISYPPLHLPAFILIFNR